MGFEGGPCKKIWPQRGDQPRKHGVYRGGHQKNLPLSLVVTASVKMQTSVPEDQK